MKKVILTLALAVITVCASAQFVVSGQLGMSHNGTSTGDNNNDATTSFTIAPKVGYMLNDKMQAGLGLGMVYNYSRTYVTNDDWNATKQWAFAIAPYFRYYALTFGKFSAFAEADINFAFAPKGKYYTYTNDKWNDGNTKGTIFDIAIVPGLNYKVNEHISMDLYINLAGIYYTHTSATTSMGSIESTSKEHSWGCMANATSQTLSDHLNNFMLGFNYAF